MATAPLPEARPGLAAATWFDEFEPPDVGLLVANVPCVPALAVRLVAFAAAFVLKTCAPSAYTLSFTVAWAVAFPVEAAFTAVLAVAFSIEAASSSALLFEAPFAITLELDTLPEAESSSSPPAEVSAAVDFLFSAEACPPPDVAPLLLLLPSEET